MARYKKLWRFNAITGYWEYVRDTTSETAKQWLKVFRETEPGEVFKLAMNKPSKSPSPRKVTKKKARALLKKAAQYQVYGPDYDRNIDTAAQDLAFALERDRRLDTWGEVLELRLRRKNPIKARRKKNMLEHVGGGCLIKDGVCTQCDDDFYDEATDVMYNVPTTLEAHLALPTRYGGKVSSIREITSRPGVGKARKIPNYKKKKNPIKGMPGRSVKGCIALNQDKDSPSAYCASIADRIEPGWRSKRKKNMKKPRRKNSSQGSAEYRELQLYIDNDYELYRQRQAIEENLKRKVKAGRYDPKKAPKLWQYMVDAGARKYCKEFGCSVRTTFPKAGVRIPLAEEYARDWDGRDWVANTPKRSSNPRMTKADAVYEFGEIYIPAIQAKEEEYGGGVDKIMRREEWNNYVDFLNQDGMISDKQAETWVMPKKFERRINPKHTRPKKPAKKKRTSRAKPYARKRKGGGKRKNPTSGVSMRSIMAKALK